VVYHQLIGQRPLLTWGVTVVVLPFAVSLYAFMDGWVIALYRPDSITSFAQLFIGVFYLDATLLGHGRRFITRSTFSCGSRSRMTS
jgi:hypothetical protein